MLPKAFVSVAIPFGAVSIKTIFLIFSSIDLRVRLKYTFNTKKTQHLKKQKNLNAKIKTFINEFNKTANGNKELEREEKNCCALLQTIFYKKMHKQVAHF